MYNQYPPPGGYPPPQQGQYPPPQGYPQNASPYPPQGGQHPPPQGQYPPPQGQYPPQQGQYPPPQGYPQQSNSPYPPQGGHYAPPQGQYPPGQGYPGQSNPSYPSQGGYGAPPPQQGYGAPGGPPPGQYGAPPPQQHGQHFAPPPGGGGPPTRPSIGYEYPEPTIAWDAGPDAQGLRKAMKGFGTDERALIHILATKDPLQVRMIRDAFSRMHGRNLEEDIKSETSGKLEEGLVQLVRGPLLNDVHLLRSAMSGLGTKEVILNDVLLGRSNADMQAIKRKYQEVFRRPLEADVKGDLSMKTERHFLIVLGACRAEDSAPVIPQAVDQDVTEIYKATEGKMGTDEMLVCSILSTRNDNQIRAIAYAYEQKFRRSLDSVIKKEFSGHMEEALVFQLQVAQDKYMHAATQLEDAMSGLGTKDQLLISRVIRYHWDQQMMANVKAAYRKKYGRDLASRIKGETSGDYERLMVACLGA
ncbi:hypothetical protein GGS20DRAFT_589950 [Poronia punctata]|nr:hypothetical protein GGS20DRAFT_589950 [Poronia punctata]